MVMYDHEILSLSSSLRSCHLFRECISSFDLIDAGFQGPTLGEDIPFVMFG